MPSHALRSILRSHLPIAACTPTYQFPRPDPVHVQPGAEGDSVLALLLPASAEASRFYLTQRDRDLWEALRSSAARETDKISPIP